MLKSFCGFKIHPPREISMPSTLRFLGIFRLFARLFAIASLVGLAAPGRALTPYRVQDLTADPIPASSEPHNFQSLGRLGLFAASDGETDVAFWRSDGTAPGTFPVMTDCAGCRIEEDLFIFEPTGPFAFWSLVDATGRYELWVTRGRPSNTVRLGQFSANRGLRGLARWVPEQGRLYFLADDGVHGEELWTSDGTVAGTSRLLNAGPTSLTPFHGAMYFGSRGGDARGVGGLWRSDGTAAGTTAVTLISSGSDFPFVDNWTPAGPHLFFVVDDVHGENLWVTDGTRQSTRRLTSFSAHQTLPSFLAGFGNRAYFEAKDGAHGSALWTSDGTVQGTHPVIDACLGTCSGLSYPLAEIGGRLFFVANDGVHGSELWATDGTRQGTAMIRDLCPGSCDSFPFSPFVLGTALLFTARDSPQGPEQLWRTDGTAAGTRLVKDINTANLGGGGAFPPD
jgi:ELWxxDGT repeat protein